MGYMKSSFFSGSTSAWKLIFFTSLTIKTIQKRKSYRERRKFLLDDRTRLAIDGCGEGDDDLLHTSLHSRQGIFYLGQHAA